MSVLIETWRGTRALVGWFAGAPFHSLRMFAATTGQAEAREYMSRRALRTLAGCGVTVEVDGEPPSPGRGAVVVYNETSFADTFAFWAVMFRYIDHGSGADVFAVIPTMRAASRRLGITLVPRGNRAGTDRVLAEMVDRVRAGERVAWGGEGKLSGRDEVARFKVGAALIAIRAGAPLVPVAFRGGHRALPLRSLRARPGRILVRFGAPLTTEGLVEADARVLADRAQAAVAELFAALDPTALATPPLRTWR